MDSSEQVLSVHKSTETLGGGGGGIYLKATKAE